MVDKPWSGFGAVDNTADPGYYIQYLDEIRYLGDTQEYKGRSFQVLGLRLGDRVLDVGCGTGLDAIAIAPRVGTTGQVVGIDPSAQLIQEAERRAAAQNRPVDFRIGDACSLPFADGYFHACRADRTFLYLDRPADALQEMARVLIAGGMLYVRDPDMQTFLVDAPDKATSRRVAEFFADSFASGWIGRELPRLFHDVGITKVSYRPKTLVLRSLAEADTMFAIRRTLTDCVKAGIVSTTDGEAWLDALAVADQQERFTFSLTFFETFGRKP
jgi:ubiquinone/menaquinone biosynthesis C-methylase UbiE